MRDSCKLPNVYCKTLASRINDDDHIPEAHNIPYLALFHLYGWLMQGALKQGGRFSTTHPSRRLMRAQNGSIGCPILHKGTDSPSTRCSDHLRVRIIDLNGCNSIRNSTCYKNVYANLIRGYKPIKYPRRDGTNSRSRYLNLMAGGDRGISRENG